LKNEVLSLQTKLAQSDGKWITQISSLSK